jgi:hypothetical protein
MESSASRFQIDIAGKGLSIFEGDHAADAHCPDVKYALGFWHWLCLVDRGHLDLLPTLLEVGCCAIDSDVQPFWRLIDLHLGWFRSSPGPFCTLLLLSDLNGTHP